MKRALVTGSTQGIGKAIAIELVKNGYEVIVHCSNDLQKAKSVQEEIGASGAVVCDLSDIDHTYRLRQETGDVDVLVLNASVQYKEEWIAISRERLDEQIDVNFKSSVILMQNYVPAMIEKGFGRVVTIGSVNQHRRHRELSIYSATKCAVMSMVENVAKEVAPHGVTVNNVSPGAIQTPRNKAVYENETMRKKVESQIPLGKFGKAEEVAKTVAFLVSSDGAYITGTDIVIDGGMRL